MDSKVLGCAEKNDEVVDHLKRKQVYIPQYSKIFHIWLVYLVYFIHFLAIYDFCIYGI